MKNLFHKFRKLPTLALPFFVFPILSLADQSFAQNNPSIYATGLRGPVGIEIDARGWLWVAEQGSGANDSQISVVTAENEVHPFITGLPSGVNAAGEVSGANHVYFSPDGELLIVQEKEQIRFPRPFWL